MSYESFRADFASRLLPLVPDQDLLQEILLRLDAVSSGYDFTLKCTDLIISDGVPEIVRLYIASKSIQNLRKNTLRNYYATLCDFFHQVRKPVEQVTSSDARLFLAYCKQKHGNSDSTLDHKRIMLNSFFEWCVDEEMLRKSPMRHVQPIRVDDNTRLPMTPLELEKVRDACKTVREKALVDFLYSTAARVSELCALELRHIDFAAHTVRIEHGKGGKNRTTFLNPEAETSLKAYLATRTDSCPALFVPIRGKAHSLNKKSVELAIQTIVSRCDLSIHVTPHVFRHTAASIALQRGMPIEQVQKFLGHAKIQTTLRYAKVLDFDVKLSHQKYVA